jgi:hypothetical protein
MTSTNIYYVYAYLRSKDSETAKAGTPYYIGKGKNDRAWNNHKRNSFELKPKDTNRIILLESNLSETIAYEIEKWYISYYGRKDLGTGILENKTNGGEGVSSDTIKGEKNPAKKIEVRIKISIARSGPRPQMAKNKNPNWKGISYDEQGNFIDNRKFKGDKQEQLKHHSNYMKENNPMKNQESRNKLSEKAKTRKTIICEHCGKLFEPGGYKVHMNSLKRKEITDFSH